MAKANNFVVQIEDASSEDFHLFGKKGAEIASLVELGLNLAPGFIITTDAYSDFFKTNNLHQKIDHLLKVEDIDSATKHIKKNMLESSFSEDIVGQIFKAYRSLGSNWKDENVVISSEESKLQIKGEATLLLSVKELWVDNFNPHSPSFKPLATIIQQKLKPQKSGYLLIGGAKSIDESVKIVSSNKLTIKDEQELLALGNKIAKVHYFPKKIKWEIVNKKIYFTDINHGLIPQIQARIGNLQPTAKEALQMGGIATGVIGKEIIVIPSLDYDNLKKLKGFRAIVIEADVTNPHLKIVLQQMGIPVVISKKTDLLPGMVATVDGLRNQVYKGDFQTWQK